MQHPDHNATYHNHSVGFLSAALSGYFVVKSLQPLIIYGRESQFGNEPPAIVIAFAAALGSLLLPGLVVGRLSTGMQQLHRALLLVVWSIDIAALLATPLQAANHAWLEALVLAMYLALSNDGKAREDRDHALVFLCSRLAVLVLVAAGAQKIASGFCQDGAGFLLLSTADPRFQSLVGTILGRQELKHLQEWQAAVNLAAGPVTLPQGKGFAHLAWLSWLVSWTEALFPIGLLWRGTRLPALLLLLGWMIVVEAFCHEFLFGTLVCLLMILWLPPNWLRGLRPPFVIATLFNAVWITDYWRLTINDFAF